MKKAKNKVLSIFPFVCAFILIGISSIYINFYFIGPVADYYKLESKGKLESTLNKVSEIDPYEGIRLSKAVDIYFSAGENEIDVNGKTISSCNRNNTINCAIYRVTWDLNNEKPLSYKLIYDHKGEGDLSPNPSPDGKYLAFEKYCPLYGRSRDIYTINVEGGDIQHIAGTNGLVTITADSGRKVQKARWPNWRTNSELTFSSDNFEEDDPMAGTSHWGDVYSGKISITAGNAVLESGEKGFVDLIIGDEFNLMEPCEKGIGDCYPESDPQGYLVSMIDTYFNPTDHNIIAGHSKTSKECSQGKEDCEGVPMVADLSTSPPTYVKVSLDTVEKKSNWQNSKFTDGLTSCAHVSWSPDGKYLICTEQHTTDKSQIGDEEKVDQDNIYVFTERLPMLIKTPRGNFSSSSWMALDGGPLFKHKTPLELYELDNNFKTANHPDPDVDKLPGMEFCNTKFHHKLAEFCGENRYIVTRVACSTNQYGESNQYLYSRIFLIDINDKENPKYFDVTGALEGLMKLEHGSFHSQAASCGNYRNPLPKVPLLVTNLIKVKSSVDPL